MHLTPLRHPSAAILPAILTLVLAAHAEAQVATSPLGWSGWVRCDVEVAGSGYSDRRTHTWVMPGGSSAVQGAFYVYPATWTVVGGGSLSRSQGNQSLDAQWAVNGAASAPLAVFVRAADGAMLIQARHSQLAAPAAIQGYQQQTVDGKKQRPAAISNAALEWSFPLIAVTRATATTPASANKARTQPTTGSVGIMQPAGSQGTASCSWKFGQGADAPAAPALIAARPVPAPTP